MNEFKAKYLQECATQKYEPSENILTAIRESNKINLKSSNETIVLNLSGCNLSLVDCNLLAKCFASDAHIEEYRFTDCLLNEDSSRIIINSLGFSKSIRLLDLKGNNLRSSGAELIGVLLKRTKTLQQLYLEWNSIGVWDSGIKAIAEGLSVNQSLHVLDLSNNQISHEGGQDIAAALKINKMLGVLDLRWNNIGVLGGRAFLSSLDHNKYISNLQIAGNNIPSDIIKAIATALKRNVDYRSIFEEQESMRRSLKQEIDHIQHEKSLQVNTLINQLEKEKVLHNTLSESTRDQASQLKCAIENLKKDNESLQAKYSLLKNELNKSEKSIHSLRTNLSTKEQEILDLSSKHANEIADLSHILEKERKAKKELEAANEEQLYAVKKQLRESLDQIEIEKLEVEKCLVNMKKLSVEHEENTVVLIQKHKHKETELERTSDIQTKTLQEKLKQYTEQNNSFQNEIAQLKSNSIADRLKNEEQLMVLHSKRKQDEMLKSKQFDERIDLLINTKDELQTKLSKLSVEYTQANTQLVSSEKELANHKHLYEQQQQLMNQRDLEHRNEINQVRIQVDSEKRITTELKNKIQNLEAKHQEGQSQLRDLKSLNETEVRKLNDAVKNKEDDLKRLRSEELRRAGLLESALQTYISSARSSYN